MYGNAKYTVDYTNKMTFLSQMYEVFFQMLKRIEL